MAEVVLIRPLGMDIKAHAGRSNGSKTDLRLVVEPMMSPETPSAEQIMWRNSSSEAINGHSGVNNLGQSRPIDDQPLSEDTIQILSSSSPLLHLPSLYPYLCIIHHGSYRTPHLTLGTSSPPRRSLRMVHPPLDLQQRSSRHPRPVPSTVQQSLAFVNMSKRKAL